MSSVKARSADVAGAVAAWKKLPPSQLLHHGGRCCQVAREWLGAMDYSLLADTNPLSGPRWLRERYQWGPSRWPIYWCEAVGEKSLDCGALAALARELFGARGLVSLPVQLIMQFSEQAASQWQKRWSGATGALQWTCGHLAYHEACAIVVDDQLRIWDAANGCWLLPEQNAGYGATLALRVCRGNSHSFEKILWGSYYIFMDLWKDTGRLNKGLLTLDTS